MANVTYIRTESGRTTSLIAQRPSTVSSSCTTVDGEDKMKEQRVYLTNFLKIKHIEEDDNKLFLDGTFIQRLLDDSSPDFFEYRINGYPDYDDCLKFRKMEKKVSRKQTKEFKVPMDVSVVHDWFPFKIVKAKVMIDLTSYTKENEIGVEMIYRPDLLIGRTDRLFNIEVELPEDMPRKIKINDFDDSPFMRRFNEYRSLIDPVKNKLDKSLSYDFITPFPSIKYYYNHHKKTCSKFEVSFELVEAGNAKFVQIVFPMLLISFLNTLNVLDDEDVDLGNSSTLALTAVFILPYIVTRSRRSRILQGNNLYIIMIFIGLTLSSVPDSMAGSKIPALAGMGLLWASFLLPVVHCFFFYQYWGKVVQDAPKIKDRLRGEDTEIRKLDNSNYDDEAMTVQEYIDSENHNEYFVEDNGKNFIVHL